MNSQQTPVAIPHQNKLELHNNLKTKKDKTHISI